MSVFLNKEQKAEEASRARVKTEDEARNALTDGFRTGKLVLGAEVFLNALDPDLIQRLTQMSINIVSPTSELNNKPPLDQVKAQITAKATQIASEYRKGAAARPPPPRSAPSGGSRSRRSLRRKTSRRKQ